jgi:hypothetical protein
VTAYERSLSRVHVITDAVIAATICLLTVAGFYFYLTGRFDLLRRNPHWTRQRIDYGIGTPADSGRELQFSEALLCSTFAPDGDVKTKGPVQ